MSILIDQKQRDEIRDSDHSLIISAPAGAGKTEALVSRMIKKLLLVEDPKEVIAITFTKKATNEMKKRIDDWIRDENIQYKEDLKKIKNKFKVEDWEIFIENLNIMTIDALALRIIQKDNKYRVFQPEILEDVKDLLKDSIDEIVEEPEFSKHIQEMLLFIGQNYQQDKKNIIKMLEKRDQWLKNINEITHLSIEKIEAKYLSYVNEEIKKRVNEINEIFNDHEIEQLQTIYNKQKTNTKPSKFKPEDVNSWKNLVELIFRKDGKIRQIRQDLRIEVDKIFINKNNNEINIINNISNVINKENIIENITILPSFAKSLKLFCVALSANFKKTNKADFTHILSEAIMILKDDPIEVILNHDVSHLLIDEFQDTNQTQVDFIELILGNFAANIPNKSLLLVGDPMQSIYRFRKAEVKFFNQINQNKSFAGLKLKSLKLITNFRSDPKIIDWINRNVVKLFPSQNNADLDAVSYTKFKPRPKINKDDGILKIHRFVAPNSSINELYRVEAKETVKIIKKIQKETPSREIAILTYSRPNIQEIIHELKLENIAIEATKIQEIKERQSFQDILSLTRALYNFNDKVHWIAVLRAPWCGIELKSLTKLFEKNHDLTAWEIINNKKLIKILDKESYKRINFVTKTINSFLSFKGHVSHRYFIESIWRMLKGYECLLEENDYEEIETFFECINECSSPLSINFDDLDKKIQDLNISKIENTDDNKKPIKILTMHASKGMGFECIILPNLNRPQKPEEKPLFINEENIIAIKKNNLDKKDGLYDYLWEKEKIRIQNEKIRLLYVSISRAKKECHLISSENMIEGESDIKPNSFLNMLLPVIKNEKILQVKPENFSDIDNFSPQLRRIKLQYLNSQIQELTPSFDQEIKNVYFENIFTFTGSLIHKYYKIIIKNQLDINEILSKKLILFKQLYLKNNFSDAEIYNALNIISTSFNTLINTKNGRWIYKLHKDDQMEVEYIIKGKDEFEKRIPDRSFIYENNRWVIDYKTVFDEKNLHVYANNFKPQLDKYEKLYDNKYPIIKAIYFCSQGELVIIE